MNHILKNSTSYAGTRFNDRPFNSGVPKTSYFSPQMSKEEKGAPIFDSYCIRFDIKQTT